MEKLLICGRDAAKLLGVDPSRLKKMREKNSLPFVRYGRRHMYSVEALRDWVRRQTQANAPTA